MMMKMMQVKKDVKKASISESLGAVRERERERERELYSNEIEEIGAKESSSNFATVKTGANIAICAKCAQNESSRDAKNRIRERGVTLIALVVTVIVLLILARSDDYGNYGR